MTLPQVKFLYELCKGHCKLALRAIGVLVIELVKVDLVKEELGQRFRVRQALEYRAHKTCVS